MKQRLRDSERIGRIVVIGLSLVVTAGCGGRVDAEPSSGPEAPVSGSLEPDTGPGAQEVNEEAVAALDRFVASGFSAQVAYLDTETGGLATPRAEQVSPLARRVAARTDAGLTEVALPGGGARLDLEGRFVNALVVSLRSPETETTP